MSWRNASLNMRMGIRTWEVFWILLRKWVWWFYWGPVLMYVPNGTLEDCPQDYCQSKVWRSGLTTSYSWMKSRNTSPLWFQLLTTSQLQPVGPSSCFKSKTSTGGTAPTKPTSKQSATSGNKSKSLKFLNTTSTGSRTSRSPIGRGLMSDWTMVLRRIGGCRRERWNLKGI